MKNSANLKVILVISSNLLFSAQLHGTCFGDRLFAEGKYQEALTEYKRQDFFSEHELNSCLQFNRQIGLCYEKLGELEKASEIFEKTKDDSDLVRIYLKMGEYSMARLICEEVAPLADLEAGSPDNGMKLTGWIYIMENKWDEAISSFENIGDIELKEIAIKGKNLPYKSQNTAILLSIVIPGMGEIYAHRWFDGLLTFSFNAITGGMSIKAFSDKRLLDGVLITTFLWNRFFSGGVENARKAVMNYNIELKQEYLKSNQGLDATPVPCIREAFPTIEEQ